MYSRTIQSHFHITKKLEVKRLSCLLSHQASIIDWGFWDTLCIVSSGVISKQTLRVGREGTHWCFAWPNQSSIIYYRQKDPGGWVKEVSPHLVPPRQTPCGLDWAFRATLPLPHMPWFDININLLFTLLFIEINTFLLSLFWHSFCSKRDSVKYNLL